MHNINLQDVFKIYLRSSFSSEINLLHLGYIICIFNCFKELKNRMYLDALIQFKRYIKRVHFQEKKKVTAIVINNLCICML